MLINSDPEIPNVLTSKVLLQGVRSRLDFYFTDLFSSAVIFVKQ